MKKKLHIVLELLNHFNYSPNKEEVKLRLFSDPDRGIVSISNTLDFFDIKNITATVPKASFDQLPTYFLAQVIQDSTHDLVLVSKIKNGSLKIVSDKRNNSIIAKEAFLENWTGLIIAIEENQQKTNHKLDKSNYLKLGLAVCSVLLITYIACLSNSILTTLYIICAILGLGLSYFILKEKMGIDETPSRFCTFSKDTDCRSVLNSKEANFFSFADLSDASVMYFSFLLLSFIIVPHNLIYFGLASLSLPIIVYSFYLQYFKIKKWCPLCLGVASVLVSQFVILWFSLDHLTFNALDALLFLLMATAVILAWYAIKQLLLVQQNNRSLVIDNMTFRRNYHLFLPYYHSAPRIDSKVDHMTDICFGNPESQITFLMITNPLCKACFEAHDELMKLLKKYGDKIQIRFRFFVPHEDKKDPRTMIAQRLLELYLYENNQFKTAFDHWYSKVSTKEWFHKWGVCKTKNIHSILSTQQQWCKENQIDYTPLVFINEKLFPRFYTPKDIVHFVESILEFEKQNKKIHA